MGRDIDEFHAADENGFSQAHRQVVGSAIGGAPIYVGIEGTAKIYESDQEGEIYAVARVSPAEAMERGLDAAREFIRAVGKRMEEISNTARPDEVTFTFSISFDVTGKLVVPVLVTGQTGASAGLSVSAVWRKGNSEAQK